MTLTTKPLHILPVAVLASLTLCASLQAEPVFRLTASDGAYRSVFGTAVSACGDYVIVGAGDETKATNVFIYHRTGTGWEEQAKLITSADPTNSGKFGHSVAMGEDYAVVGAPYEYHGAGRVYVYQRSGTNWSPAATFIPPKLVPEPAVLPYFGQAVAAHADLIAVGAPLGSEAIPGSVFLYRRTTGVWQFEDQLSTTNGSLMFRCGWDVACGWDAAVGMDTVAILGQVVQGADVTARGVVIWQKSANKWSPFAYLMHSQRYYAENARLALTTNAVILGDPGATNASGEVTGAAFLFNAPSQGWGFNQVRLHEDAKFTGAPTSFGLSAFGTSVAIDGDVAVVGAPGSYVYTDEYTQVLVRNGGVWQKHADLRWFPWRDPNDFGKAVAISSGRVFVGAPRDAEYFGSPYGAVYVLGSRAPAPAYGPTPAQDWNWAQYGECSPVLPTNTTLAWTNGDAATSMDLYFNLGESPTNKVLDNVALVTAFDSGPLQPNRLYSWQVVERNAFGETGGPIWRFGTAGALDFAVSPDTIPFGTLITNTVSTPRAVSVQNPGAVSIWIEARLSNAAFWMGMEANGTPTNFDNQLNFYLKPGAQSNLVVVYVPASVGHHQDALSLLSYGTAAERRTNFVSLSGDGIAPTAGAPSNPSPANGTTDQHTETDLGWQNGAGTTAVDLLFSKVGQPMVYLLSNAPPVSGYALPRLNYNTTYQWQVVCRGGGGNTAGPVWTFATGVPLIEVMSPNGREQWRAGTSHPIAWKYKGDADTVRLDLYMLDAVGRRVFVSTLASNVPSDLGTLTWNIDPRLEPRDDYFIRVRDGNELNYSDYSDEPFSVAPTIVVVHPNGGEEVRAGAPCTLTWLGAGLGGGVQVELWQNGSYYRRLDRQSNTGSMVWNVPCDLEGRGFQIFVFWLEDDSLNDLSDGFFDVAILRPDAASDPAPADRAENVSLTPMLAWTNGAGTCTVDLFVGHDDPPDGKIFSDVATNQFQLAKLKPESRLYWRVVSRNAAGTTEGPVWSFTTMAAIQPPRLAMPTRNGNHLEFQWTPYQAGVQWRFQSTTNLAVAFTELGVVQTNRFIHTNGATMPSRFYRVLSEPKP
jgi:hypothetical protein